MKAIYQSLPGERLRLLPDGSTIVAHPEREPFLIKSDGQRRPLTCRSVAELHGRKYVAHEQSIYLIDETGLTPIHMVASEN